MNYVSKIIYVDKQDILLDCVSQNGRPYNARFKQFCKFCLLLVYQRISAAFLPKSALRFELVSYSRKEQE